MSLFDWVSRIAWWSLAGSIVVAVVGSVLLVYVPSVFPPAVAQLHDPMSQLEPLVLLIVTGLFVGVAASLSFVLNRTASDTLSQPIDRPPETPRETPGPVVGSSFDQTLEQRPDTADQTLSGLAVELLADTDEYDRDTAASAIADGSWTENPRAAAFLADEVTPPWPVRLRDWLASAPAARRQARATVDELVQVYELRRDRTSGGKQDE